MSLAAWKRAMGYGLRLLSDFWPHGAIGRRYGVFDEELGVNTRGTFLVDGQATVRRVISSPAIARPRDVGEYLEMLRGL